METILRGTGQKVIIGERINPTGKKKLAAVLLAGDLEIVRQEALAQVEVGADVLDVNVGAAGVDEVDLLPRAVRLVMETVDVPQMRQAAPDAYLIAKPNAGVPRMVKRQIVYDATPERMAELALRYVELVLFPKSF